MRQFQRNCRNDIEGISRLEAFNRLCRIATILKMDQIGFKMFLNITPTVSNWSADHKSFSLIFDENPLADFVELPNDGRAQDELWFSNILCGILRGALEMVSSHVPTASVPSPLCLDAIFPCPKGYRHARHCHV